MNYSKLKSLIYLFSVNDWKKLSINDRLEFREYIDKEFKKYKENIKPTEKLKN